MLRTSRFASLIAVALAVVASFDSAQAQCVTGGLGGTFGTNTASTPGAWDFTLPGDPLISTLNVTVPSGATVLNSVVLRGLDHTWAGDVHVILQSPAGQQYNVFVIADATSPTSGGCNAAILGDYTVVDFAQGSGCGPVDPPVCGTGLPPGTYAQNYSTWTSGSAGVLNTPLEQIPLANGTWTLYIHDWYPPLDSGSLLSWDLCFGSPTPPPPTSGGFNCVTGGGGGAFPATGSVEGTWPTVLPTGQLTSTLAVTVPAGATKIKGLRLNGLNHTWLGDCQIVLTSPAGVNYNIFQEVDGVFGGGCAATFAGDYVFTDPITGSDECGSPAGIFTCLGASLTPGFYGQFYGAWTSGDAGIVNVNMDAIPLASGNWTLSIYDWFLGADGGSLTSWDLCFDAPTGPVAYCTAGTTSNGCLPSIAATAQPSASLSGACTINVTGVEGQKTGLMFYGVDNTGFTPVAWGPTSNSFLCVKPPTQRMFSQNSGGIANTCSGALTQNWNTFQSAFPSSLGNPFSAGDKVYVQAWFRDPAAPKTTNLSNGLELTMIP